MRARDLEKEITLDLKILEEKADREDSFSKLGEESN